ncbi:hypothetical protein BH09BAC5_BH09BAC5_17690 [soil metagenome]
MILLPGLVMRSFAKFFFCLCFVYGSFSLTAQNNDDSTFIWQKNIYQDTVSPYFALSDVNGNFWCSDSLKGKVIVLNFWSIYCPPCISELPELNKIPLQFSEDSVVFISVLFEKGKTADSLVNHHEFKYHLAMNGRQIMGDYYNNCFPTHIIIDRSGIIRYNSCGVVNRNILIPEIKRALSLAK